MPETKLQEEQDMLQPKDTYGEYTLEILPPKELIIGNQPLVKEGQDFIGYLDFDDILLSNTKQCNIGMLWKFPLESSLVDSKLERFAPLHWGKFSDNKKVAVRVGESYVFEKLTREFVLPLGQTQAQYNTFCKKLYNYSQAVETRKKEAELRSLASQLASLKGCTLEEAMALIKK